MTTSFSEIANAIVFRPIILLERSYQMQILTIRNQLAVRKHMYTSHEITEEEHIRWLAGLEKDASTQLSAVFYRENVVGSVGLKAISLANSRADWAFYLDPSVQNSGLGSALEFVFLNYAFGDVGLLKLNCEVLSSNQRVISLHKKFGFKEEGVRRQHVRRNGEVFDSHLLGITRDEWTTAREELERRLFR